MNSRKKRPPITPDDPFTGSWCLSCWDISSSKNFCLLGPRVESCVLYKHDKYRDFALKEFLKENRKEKINE